MVWLILMESIVQLLVNDVFNLHERLVRVLYHSGNMVVFFYLDSKPREVPFSMVISELEEKIINDEASRAEDPFVFVTRELDEKSLEQAQRRLDSLTDVVTTPECLYRSTRYKLIVTASKSTGVAIKSLYKWLRQYWQRGQTLYALLPNFHKCGGKSQKRSDTSKLGRPRNKEKDIGKAPEVKGDVLKIFRAVTDQYLLTKKHQGITYAHRRIQSKFKDLYPDTKEKDLPTFSQYRYFIQKELGLREKLIKTISRPDYENNVAPLIGSSAEKALGPGSRFEIDATIADIYLVSDKDPSLIIGRPTLYTVVDTFSRLVVGFYIGMESPSYVTAMRAVGSIFMDWQAYGENIGVEIIAEHFIEAGMPDSLLADRGELLGHQIEMLSKVNSVIIEFAPPFRAISKGIVERYFRTLQASFKKFVPGVVEGVMVKKRGGKDYRLDATLNLTEFKQIIFTSIVRHNNFHTIKKYDRAEDMPRDLPAIPKLLWNWGLQNRTGRLRQANSSNFQLALLPRQKVTFDDRGISIFGVYFTCRELFKSGWLHRHSSVNRPKNLEAAYDPADANKIYLFVNTRKLEVWECGLAPHSREFQNRSFWDVFLINAERRKMDADNRLVENKHIRELEDFVEITTQKAIKRKSKKLPESKRARVRAIDSNKKKEITKARKERLIESDSSTQNELSDVHLLPSAEFDDDFEIPDNVELLFDDED